MYIEVFPQKVEYLSEQIKRTEDKMKKESSDLYEIREQLKKIENESMNKVIIKISNQMAELEQSVEKIKILQISLYKIAWTYKKFEESITDISEGEMIWSVKKLK